MTHQGHPLQLVVFYLSLSEILSTYVYYPDLNRRCIPMLNCAPGNSIQPCVESHQQDLCTPCQDDWVQPDWISSTGNTTETACFKPSGECLALDITYNRNIQLRFCESLKGCKCKLTDCNFGDPCLCGKKEEGCPPGTELNQDGECVNCPAGTVKNDTGCGPCRRIVFIPRRQEDSSIKEIISTSALMSIPRTTQYSKGPATAGNSPPARDNSNTAFIAIIIGLGIVVLVLVLVLVCWYRKQNGCTFERRNDTETGGNDALANQGQQQVPLMAVNKDECLTQNLGNEPKTDQHNLTPDNNDKKQNNNDNTNIKGSNRNRNPSASEEYDSGLSGIHEEDEEGPCICETLNDTSDYSNYWECNTNSKLNHEVLVTVFDEKDIRRKIKLLETEAYDCINHTSLDKQCVGDISMDLKDLEDDTANFKKVNHYLSENQSPVTTESEPPLQFPHIFKLVP